LAIVSLSISTEDKSTVMAAGVLNVVFFFSAGCAAAVGLDRSSSDTTYWVRPCYLMSRSDPRLG
jgi:hypothetical protein